MSEQSVLQFMLLLDFASVPDVLYAALFSLSMKVNKQVAEMCLICVMHHNEHQV